MALGNAENTLVLTTCGWEGSGWDYLDGWVFLDGQNYIFPEESNSLWTYWFLMQGLVDHFGYDPSTTMEAVFEWALNNYPEGSYDINVDGTMVSIPMGFDYEPEIFDGDQSNDIIL